MVAPARSTTGKPDRVMILNDVLSHAIFCELDFRWVEYDSIRMGYNPQLYT